MHTTPEPLPPAPSGSPLGLGPTGLSNVLTLVLSLLLATALMCATVPGPGALHLHALTRPIDTAVRVFERNLALEAALEAEPSWRSLLLTPLISSPGSAREGALTAFEELLATGGFPKPGQQPDQGRLDGLRARRAVLLAESGRLAEARGDLDLLAKRGYERLTRSLERAYSGLRLEEPAALTPEETAPVGQGWIGARLALRLAQAAKDAPAVDAAEGRLARLRLSARAAAGQTGVAWLLPLAAGLLLLMAWLLRNRPAVPRASAVIPPVWPFEVGYAVLVRAAFLGLSVVVGLQALAAWSGWTELALAAPLLAALPLLWLGRWHLLRPHGASAGLVLGLRGLGRPFAWAGFTLGLFALLALGGLAITQALAIAGVQPHWAELVQERLLWSPTPLAALDLADGVLWTPLIEELGFRGLLYLTLRRKYGPWRSALLAGALYGVVHFNSLPGLLAATWTGFVLSLAFERCRSLVPLFAAHALLNAGALGAVWLLYR